MPYQDKLIFLSRPSFIKGIRVLFEAGIRGSIGFSHVQ